MASKSVYQSSERGAEIEELLNELEKLLERLRAMYEQYFLGIARMAPTSQHTEAERRIRDLTQVQIKNTALRYRFATLSQKFSAYNTYWKRTMRMIEQGKYVRDLQRVQRKAERSGEAIPEEILAAMPKAMRERVLRDRANALVIAEREGKVVRAAEPGQVRSPSQANMHRLDEALVADDIDVESMFATLTREAEEALDASPPIVMSRPPAREEFEGISSPNLPGLPDEHKQPAAARKKVAPTTPPLRPPSAMRGGGAPPPIPPPRPGTTVAVPPPPVPRAAAVPATPPPRQQTVVGLPPPPSRPSGMPPGARPSVVPPGARAGTPPMAKPPAPPPGMNDSETRVLYQKYLKARELCGENNDGVTYDKLMRTLRSQSSKIMTDGRVKGVEFGVVIKDNKVVLKAKPKV